MGFNRFLWKVTDADRDTMRERGEVRHFKSGDVIISQDDKIDELFVVKIGNLRVTRILQESMVVEFAGPLGPGDAIGEMSFVDGKGASATLVADGDVELLAIPKRVIEDLQAADPTFSGRFYESLVLELAHKLRSTNQRILPQA